MKFQQEKLKKLTSPLPPQINSTTSASSSSLPSSCSPSPSSSSSSSYSTSNTATLKTLLDSKEKDKQLAAVAATNAILLSTLAATSSFKPINNLKSSYLRNAPINNDNENINTSENNYDSSNENETELESNNLSSFGHKRQRQPSCSSPLNTNTNNNNNGGSSGNVLNYEPLNTADIAQKVRDLLSLHNIGQRIFAKFILGLSQGTVSELLSKPKHWDKLTEKGRESYRKMYTWSCSEQSINTLKAISPRKGNKDNYFYQNGGKEDSATEEKIAQILFEAQKQMQAKGRTLNVRNPKKTKKLN